MGSPTKIDYENASMYTFEREKLFDFNYHLKNRPHIASWINVQIRSNQNIPSRNESQFNRNIYVRLVGTKTFCEQVHCNPNYYRGKTCIEKDSPMVFKSGNTDIIGCQSSCYNIYNNAKDEANQSYKAPFTIFNETQSCCTLHSDMFFRLGFDDSIRSDVATPRITTIGTGFDLSDQPFKDGVGNETYHFKINKYYCDDFKYKFKNGECEPSTSEWLNTLIGSEVLYKSVQYGVRKITTGVGLSDINKPSLPPITLKPQSFNEWTSNINRGAHFFNVNLKLSDLGITSETRHMIFTTEYGWPGILVEPLIVYQSIKPNVKIVDYSNGKNLLPQFRYDEYGRRENDEYDLIGSYETLRKLNEQMDGKFSDPLKIDGNVIVSIFEGMKEFLTGDIGTLGITISSIFLNEFANLLKKVVKFAETKFNKVAMNMVMVAERTLISSIIKQSGIQALKIGTRLFKLALSSLKIISVVGMILDIVGLIDLFFIGRDVFGQNNLGTSKFTDSYSEGDLAFLEEIYGYKTVEFSPALYFNLFKGFNYKNEKFTMDDEMSHNVALLTNPQTPFSATVDDVKLDDSIMYQFLWQTEYLISLEKNSDNFPIMWDDEVNLNSFDKFLDGLKIVPKSYEGYSEYTETFIKRKKTITSTVVLSIVCLLISVFLQIYNPLKNEVGKAIPQTFVFLSMLIGIISFLFTMSIDKI